MPKQSGPRTAPRDAGKVRALYSLHPWRAKHQPTQTEIEAYVEASSAWETVLTVHATSGASPETVAALILTLVHEHQSQRTALHDALDALEGVMTDGLTFTTEQAAERAVTKIRRVI